MKALVRKMRAAVSPKVKPLSDEKLAAYRRSIDLGQGPAAKFGAPNRMLALRGFDSMRTRRPAELERIVREGSDRGVRELIDYFQTRRPATMA